MADTDLSIEEDTASDDVVDVELDEEPDAADLEDDSWDDLDDSLVDDDDDEDDDDEVIVATTDSDDEDDGEDDDDEEALDELEAEELEMLTDDEASETLIVDEQQELRAIRRAEISLADDAGGARAEDEFLCQSCFLVLKTSQLADKRRKYCRDCAG